MKMFTINTNFGGYRIYLERGTYRNGNLAVYAYCLEDGHWVPFASLTTNIQKLQSDEAAIDTNNFPEGLAIITEHKLGKLVGTIDSGYCTYPVVKFNMDRLEYYTSMSVRK